MQPNAEVGRLLATLPPDTAREAFLRSPTALDLSARAPDNFASLTGFFDRSPQAGTAALLQRISADGPDVSERQVREIRVPTLVLGTDRDLIHPMAHAELLAALIPGARLVAIASKAESRARYVADFHAALGSFLEDFR